MTYALWNTLWSSGAVYMPWSSFYPVVISSCWSFYSLRSDSLFLYRNGSRRFSLTRHLSLSFSSAKILILIQIASILGILVFALKRKGPDSLCSLSLSQLSRFTALYNVLQISSSYFATFLLDNQRWQLRPCPHVRKR